MTSSSFCQQLAQSSKAKQTGQRDAGAPSVRLRFALIGDYGDLGLAEWGVSDLVHDFDPDLVLTLGDNNYPSGSASTIDNNIGFFYHDYIAPYLGVHGAGADQNRFFPALGNHDWIAPGAQPYLDYFALPGNERYYDLRRKGVHFFILDSDPSEPDGTSPDSIQALWLQAALADSTAPFKLVLMHHAPYSSARHGPHPGLQWPFGEWGAQAVFAGHDHVYERLCVDGLPYAVNGLGGRPFPYAFRAPIAGSRLRFNQDFGALLVELIEDQLRIQFVTQDNLVVDDFSVFADEPPSAPEVLVAKQALWSYLDTGFAPIGNWTSLAFDDSAWSSAAAQLGYGEGDEATLLSFGPDPNDKHPVSYLRHVFDVVDPASVDRCSIALQADDGAVIYLNGAEFARQNMPGGVLDNSTLASSDVDQAPEKSFYEFALAPALLQAGSNLLAVSLHQSSGSSDDLSFALELSLRRDIELLVPRGSLWNYLDTGVDPGALWMQPGFDDGAWLQGAAQLGYGDGDEATLVSFGPDPMAKHISTYFRAEFDVLDPVAIQYLELALLRDDGAIVYLNGREVLRNNLLRGYVGPLSLAGADLGPGDESSILRTRIHPKLLQLGSNLLAVEVHQAAPTSSDLSFDLELCAW